MLKDAQVRLMILGVIGGMIHDWQCFRKSVNEWEAKASTTEPRPRFDYLCFLLHALQGLMVGTGAGQAFIK